MVAPWLGPCLQELPKDSGLREPKIVGWFCLASRMVDGCNSSYTVADSSRYCDVGSTARVFSSLSESKQRATRSNAADRPVQLATQAPPSRWSASDRRVSTTTVQRADYKRWCRRVVIVKVYCYGPASQPWTTRPISTAACVLPKAGYLPLEPQARTCLEFDISHGGNGRDLFGCGMTSEPGSYREPATWRRS
jgi:hypothetical protein